MSEASESLRADQRRLAAILAADVAGYSRLMGQDEAATVRDLEAHQAVILPLIAKHGGSIVNIAGDGIVAQFPSAVRAVECAVAIQKIMAERNADVPADRRMLMRIGVNLGDIIDDGSRAYGDGINVAARLEPLAEPGGICISAPVRDAIFGKLGLPLRDIGEKSLKNIDRPVHIYQIQPPGARARRHWLEAGLRQYRRLAPALGLVVLLAAVAGIGAWRFWPRETLTPEPTPIIAVLPFGSAGGDANLDTLGPSFGREISAVLSTFPQFRIVFVTGLPSQRLADPKQAAKDLGAAFALGGDLARSGGKTRIRAQLTDAASGEMVWSDSCEFEGEDIIAIQEKTAERIYQAIGGSSGEVRKIEEEAAWRRSESALTDYDYFLRATSYYRRYTQDDNLRSRKIALGGLKRFPDSSLLKIRLAWTYQIDNTVYGPFENCRESAETAYKLGREVEDAKNKSRYIIYQSHVLMAYAYQWHGEDFDRSVKEAEAAVEMSPYDAPTKGALAYVLVNAGWVEKAIEWASWAMAHDIRSHFSRNDLAWAYYAAGRYEEALETFKPLGDSWNPAQAAAHYASVGRLEEAKAAVVVYLKSGRHSIATESCAPMREPLKQKYLNDLRKAGLPERTGQ